VPEPAEQELDAWMARLAEGERAAFEPLFRALYPRALRFAVRTLSDESAADAAQAILMNVFARASEFESGRPVLPWFYAACANEVRTLRRREERSARRTANEARAFDRPGNDDPERALLDFELRSALARALENLDETSARTIATVLGDGDRPAALPAAFRKRVSRAYARLRLLLGGYDD
jgi:RNA polymerase sigma-70 factor (ECF subfamily)